MGKKKSRKREKAKKLLAEMVMDHLGIPKPKTTEHMKKLQDELLPKFLEWANTARFLAESRQETDIDYSAKLKTEMEVTSGSINDLNEILYEQGVYDLLDDIAASSYAKGIKQLSVPEYDAKLLQATGHTDPHNALVKQVQQVSKKPELLSKFGNNMEKAPELTLKVHSGDMILLPTSNDKGKDKRRKRRKRRSVLNGLTKMFQGFVLVSGNVILVPTVPLGALAGLPVLTSLVAGVGYVGGGVDSLLEAIDDGADAQAK